jgi:hypothetical protein
MKNQCGMDRQKTHMPAQGLLWRSGSEEGTPARELKPTAAYRLGIDKGGGERRPKKVTGWENPQ